MRLILALAASCISVGCASTAVIRTNPSGAQVLLNGSVVGRTPYVQTDTDPVVVPSKRFTLQMPGYETTTVTAVKSDWNNAKTVGFALGGLFVWPIWAGLLWAPDYPQIPEVQLVPERSARPPPAPRLRPPPPPAS